MACWMLGCGALMTCSSSLELSESESDPPAKNRDMFNPVYNSLQNEKEQFKLNSRRRKLYEVNIYSLTLGNIFSRKFQTKF